MRAASAASPTSSRLVREGWLSLRGHPRATPSSADLLRRHCFGSAFQWCCVPPDGRRFRDGLAAVEALAPRGTCFPCKPAVREGMPPSAASACDRDENLPRL